MMATGKKLNDLNFLFSKKLLFVFQNNLIFCPLFYTPKLCNPDYVKVTSRKSVGVSTEEIRLADTTLTPEVKYSTRIKKGLKFNKLF